MKQMILIFLFTMFSFSIFGQDSTAVENLPYYEIPAAPESYTSEAVTSRMIDGLGYRYYWSTKDLTEKDLKYKAGETNRTTMETLEHLFGLSKFILTAIKKEPIVRGGDRPELPEWEEMRKQTLINFKTASDLLRAEDAKVEDMKIVFQRGEQKSEVPFWNLINGPIADAIWHTGQVVSFRRASGNPLPPGVNVFMGKTMNK